jgi:hypothetical protein
MASERFCPICKNKNVETASVCSYCGASLEGNATNLVAITEYIGGQPNAPAEDVAAFIDVTSIPEGGVGIHIAGAPKPYYVPIYKELILGRQTDATLEAVLDLSDLDAFNMGISRRHAMIRRAEFGFEVIDLSSRNGTWLNAEQLIPNKPYPFASGSQLRLGRMRLFVVYHVAGKDTQKK